MRARVASPMGRPDACARIILAWQGGPCARSRDPCLPRSAALPDCGTRAAASTRGTLFEGGSLMHTERQAMRLRTLRRDEYRCQVVQADVVFGGMKCYRKTSLVRLLDSAGLWVLGNLQTACAWHGGTRVDA